MDDSSRNDSQPHDSQPLTGAAELDRLCHQILLGRESVQKLKELLGSREISVVEFHLLWHLRYGASIDQRSLAAAIGVSTAQISASVERMRQRRLIVSSQDPQDRRRQQWRLAIGGVTMLTSLTTPGLSWISPTKSDIGKTSASELREAA